MNFKFITDKESQYFSEEIVREIIVQFGVSEREAVGRINQLWEGQEVIGDSVVYHEEPDYWAKVVCYGADCFWWVEGESPKLIPYEEKGNRVAR